MFTSKSWMVPLYCVKIPAPLGNGGEWNGCCVCWSLEWLREKKKKKQSKTQLSQGMVHREMLRVGEGQIDRAQ